MKKLKGKRVLVTGGAGFIGSHLVDLLATEGPETLAVVDNLFLGKTGNLDRARSAFPDLRFFEEDAGDAAVMRRLLGDLRIQVVFDLAVIPLPKSLEEPGWSVNENVRIVTTLCDAARDGLFETLIHFSSSEAYGTLRSLPMGEDHPEVPETPYAASKLAGDHIALSYRRTFGIDTAILRPFNNYGPRQNEGNYAGIIPIVMRKLVRGEPIEVFGDGEQTRDFVYATDTARAAVAMYEREETRGRIVNMASGQETTVNRLVDAMRKAYGSPDHPIVHGEPRAGDVRRHCGGIDLARELLGFEPETTLADGLQRTVDWYRTHVFS